MIDVTFDEAGFKALIAGPVEQDLVRRAIRVQAAAKHNATRRPGPMVRTGRLRDSIEWKLGHDSVSPYVDIGSSVLYAPYVELGHGNTPHAFPLVTSGGSFVTNDKGGVVFGYVSDRVTPAYPYLRPALDAARASA